MTNPKRKLFLGKIISMVYTLLLCLEICSCNQLFPQQPQQQEVLTAGTGETPDAEETNGGGTGGTGGTPSRGNPPNGTPPGGGSDEAGIPNVGNTCYLNSTMQILARLYPDIFDGKTDDLAKAGKVIVDKIANKQAITRREAEALRDQFLKEINETKPEARDKLQGGRQEDAQEAFSFFYDKYLPKSKPFTQVKHVNCDEPSVSGFPILRVNKTSNSEWEMLQIPMDGENLATMSDSFSRCLCEAGAGVIEDYTLGEIPKDRSDPDQESRLKAQYVGFNVEDNGRGRYLIKGKIQKKEPRFGLGRFPHDVLPVQLMRFGFSIESRESSKICTQVGDAFQLTIPSNCILDSPGDKVYNLVGFILHLGSTLKAGHYIAYILKENQWIEYDDNVVSLIKEEKARKAASDAYLYFYKPTS